MGAYSREDQNAVAIAQQAVSDTLLPMLAGAATREQAFYISLAAVTASLSLAAGAWAAVNDLDLKAEDELSLAEEVLKMMREVRNQ